MYKFFNRCSVVVAISAVCVVLLFFLERDNRSVPFAIAVVLTLTVLIFNFTQRVRASLLLAWCIVFIVAAISLTKQRLMGFNVHVFDLLSFATDSDSLHFVLINYWKTLIPLPVALLLAAWFVRGLFRADRPLHIAPLWRLAGIFSVAVFLTISYPRSPGDHGYYMGGHFATSLFVSLTDTSFLFEEIELTREVAAREVAAPFDRGQICGDMSSAPDLYIIHMESMFSPSLYPDWKFGGPDSYLARETADWRPLRVETFAGASWTTTFSLMTGLPAIDFGWMRPYLPIFMAGKVKNALPQLLAACGYRTLAVMPTRYEMVNEGPFLKSIGFEEVYDRDDVGAGASHARDRLFYEFTMALVSDHKNSTDRRPLFVFVQTMTTHGPYDDVSQPEDAVGGMPFGNRPDIDEFLRRMTLARQDFAPFLAFVDQNKAKGGAVVVEYGDHQPSVSQDSADAAVRGQAAADWNSPLYQTYFDVHAYGRDVKSLPPMTMDVGFLGVTIADAVGLPNNAAQRALLMLRDQCAGSYHSCADKALVWDHLGKLTVSDLLELP
ncbi:sulfatase-like hydrolase/transferase [Rhizobium rhizophilum]|uniref:Sulfatase N-terminal domain-containing protein n=1 Tax=Rhizobium rhizophilum TaxID=1850373 RepID=A0ABY2QXG8_9HYPH|nr:sulfatase-like hydrolase/transferase [Rhizobium rhizophilum]THV15784.1 hypothetical protein E9677_10635 [Rhizobium rhizophilum]